MNDLRPLQRLSFAVAPSAAAHMGERGELAFLPLKHLFVDPAYQRDILDRGKANIRRMIEEFSWERFGACVVARRGKDRYAIIDGQHRATAAFNRGGIDMVPCLILKGDHETEARAFNAINTNITRIQPLQSFRAAVAGGDKDAIALVNACAEAGVAIARHSNTDCYRPGETSAFGTMQKCLKRDGAHRFAGGGPGRRASGVGRLRRLHPCAQASGMGEGCRENRRLYRADGKTLAGMCIEAQSRKMQRGGTIVTNFAALLEAAVAAGERAADPRLKKMMAGR